MSTSPTFQEESRPTVGGYAGFQQRLNLFDATMLVVGTMIGSGIFVVSQSIAQDVGGAGWLMAVWLVAGLMTVMGALCYAELAAMMPHAGGQYVYLREAYNPLCGFLYGWTCFLVIQTGSIAAVGVVFAKYLGVLVPALGTENVLWTIRDVNIQLWIAGIDEPIFAMKDFTVTAGQLVAVATIILLTWLNCRGIQEGKLVQNIFTVAKVMALLGLIVVGLFVVSDAEIIRKNTADLWSAIATTEACKKIGQKLGSEGLPISFMVAGGAMVGALFSSDAWNNVTFTAGETRNPRRNLPLSLALGTGFVILLYLLANVAYLACLPIEGDASQAGPVARGIAHARDQRVATAVMELWSPGLGAALMALAIMISTFGCNNGLILMGARLYYVMARDNLFFRSVGTLNARGVPAVGLILQSAWSILLVFSGTYDDLLDFVIFAVLVFYVLTVVGLFVLRRTRPDADRPYRAFGYPLVPALYVACCSSIMVDLLIVKPKFTWPGLIIVLTGIPVFGVWRVISRTSHA
jgi:basic amino acid/polyamine antiporter, APA family